MAATRAGSLKRESDDAPQDALSALIANATTGRRGPAPVEKWEPEHCGTLDIVIRRDGSWTYMGTPIGRKALVDLFATVLRKDADGQTYLVTPVEKIGITVEDAPFVAVEMAVSGAGREQILTFRTQVGDIVEAGPEHPLRFEEEAETGGIKPYLHVRGRLEALVNRATTHDLLNRLDDSAGLVGVWSNGAFFAVADGAA